MDIWFWDILKWLFAIIGHLGLWCFLYNHIHATAWPRWHRKSSEKVIFLIILLPMVWVLTVLIGRRSISFEAIYDVSPIAYYYGFGCLLLACFVIYRWVWRKSTLRLPNAVTEQSSHTIDIASRLNKKLVHGRVAGLLARIPGNQTTQLSIDSKTFSLPGCPSELDGFKICQLSDLHFTGCLAPEYFLEVVRYANEFQPNLILITGDIVDYADCLPWVGSVLAKLKSTHGIYYVLGNHDRRIGDESLLRNTLADNGIIAAGGKWHTIEFNGAKVLLAGNELPWYHGAEVLPTHPKGADCDSPKFRLLMSHSPDQIAWAKPYQFDLMFAGHTHGGQIRFPVIGPVVAPSKYGVKYCAGTFQIDDMLMHVSRGLSGDDMIRLNCPPELGLFTLQCHASIA